MDPITHFVQHSGKVASMVESHRLLICKACRHQIRICTRCDRGNVYCSKHCARKARCRSLHRSGRRYQKTPRGKRNHAARQMRYRKRQQQKVTHQGPHNNRLEVRDQKSTATKTINPPAVQKEVPHEHNSEFVSNNDSKTYSEKTKKTRCHFCLRPCGEFSRLDPLRRSRPKRRRRARQPVARIVSG